MIVTAGLKMVKVTKFNHTLHKKMTYTGIPNANVIYIIV